MRLPKTLAPAVTVLISLLSPVAVAAQEEIPCNPEPTNMPISFGEIVACAIDQVGDSDLFNFVASEDDRIIIQVAETAGGTFADPCVEVFFGGTEVGSACESNNPRLDLSLVNNGLHTIVISDGNDDATLNYTLGLQRIFPSSDGATPICFGCLIEDELGPTGDLDLFTFEADAGDAVIIQVAETAGGTFADPCLEVFFGGNLVTSQCESNNPRLDLILATAGLYTIVISDGNDDTMLDYTIVIERIQPLACSTTPICFGCLLQGSIDPTGDLDVFAFEGKAGDFVMLTVAEVSGSTFSDPCVELFHPDLTIDSDCDSNNAMIDLTLSENGVYNVVVSDSNDDTSLNYDVTVQCIGNCDSFELQCGEIFSDGFESGNTSVWSATLP